MELNVPFFAIFILIKIKIKIKIGINKYIDIIWSACSPNLLCKQKGKKTNIETDGIRGKKRNKNYRRNNTEWRRESAAAVGTPTVLHYEKDLSSFAADDDCAVYYVCITRESIAFISIEPVEWLKNFIVKIHENTYTSKQPTIQNTQKYREKKTQQIIQKNKI